MFLMRSAYHTRSHLCMSSCLIYLHILNLRESQLLFLTVMQLLPEILQSVLIAVLELRSPLDTLGSLAVINYDFLAQTLQRNPGGRRVLELVRVHLQQVCSQLRSYKLSLGTCNCTPHPTRHLWLLKLNLLKGVLRSGIRRVYH
jgi:hypothetical protein